MSLRFIHTGDVHVGAKFVKLGEKGKSQRNQIKDTFSNIVDLAIEKKVDALLIAGDLFDNTNPSEYSISFVKRLLRKLNDSGIYSIIVPGTHDRLESGSVFATDNFQDCGDKVHVFTDSAKTDYAVSELDTVFYAKPNLTNKSTESPITGFEKNETHRYHVALAHGSLQIEGKSSPDDYPITSDEISKSGMNYIALAHWHNTLDVSSGSVKAYYCGSPELVALDQSGSGNVLYVEVDGDDVNIETIKIGKRSVKDLIIDVGSIPSVNELTNKILSISDKNVVLNLELTGFWQNVVGFDSIKFLESIENDFFYINLIDKTALSADSYDENKYPDDYLIGRFIKVVKDSEIDEKDKSEVLKFGVSLLEGKNIL